MRWRSDDVDRISLYCTGATAYLLVLSALPFLNYRAATFFTLLGGYALSPLILVELSTGALATYFFVSATIRVLRRQNEWMRPAFRFCIIAVAFLVNTLLMYEQIAIWSQQSGQHFLADNPIYHAIAGVSSIALAVIVGLVLFGVPLFALPFGIWNLFRRRWAAVPCLAVIALGYVCTKVGDRANDILTVQSCLPASYRPVDAGRAAICSLDSLSSLGFSDYIVHDLKDVKEHDVAERVRPSVYAIGCNVSARRVTPGYYWVITGC